jgi:lactate dehydrogenase-like 2-hydroxyacid dehydrogenase
MKILLTRKWPTEVETALRGSFDVTLNQDDAPLGIDELTIAAREFDVICPTVTDRLPAQIFDQPGVRVRLICNYGAGFEHIDIEACRRAGITVTNTPDVLTDATAELAILLMLMVARRAGEGERELRAGAWTGWRPTHMLATLLTGKTLGLIGFGRIARRTAEFARGFGMDVLYHSRTRASLDIEQPIQAKYCANIDQLLASADFVSLHCPGGPETEKMINAAKLARMRQGAFLINTARGSVIDEDALAAALHGEVIAGAGLDVFCNEPRISKMLLEAPNLVMLPHIGSATIETRVAMGMRALANLRQWAAGNDPVDRIA